MATTLTPFLYQTRTILKASAAIRPLSTAARQLHRSPREQPIPFEWEGSAEEQRRGQLEIPSGPNGPVKSTITRAESQVFRKIFTDIAAGLPNTPNAPNSRESRASTAEQLLEYAYAKQASRPGSSSREAILRRYPASLRRAAESALGLRVVDEDDEESFEPFHARVFVKDPVQEDPEVERMATELKAVRNEMRALESQKLQELLDRCKTDFEVWDVLEREVFSMVERLGIAEEKKPTEAARKKEKLTEADREKTKPTLNMDSHGPLYSMLVLQGLKTLDQAFAQSSPLALNVLTRVKELGLASFVLGVSTPLYNELASILWFRHGDIPGVLALLDEMQYAGLFYDTQTLRLIDTVELASDTYRYQTVLGAFAEIVGTTPGYTPDFKIQVARCARRVRLLTREHYGSAKY